MVLRAARRADPRGRARHAPVRTVATGCAVPCHRGPCHPLHPASGPTVPGGWSLSPDRPGHQPSLSPEAGPARLRACQIPPSEASRTSRGRRGPRVPDQSPDHVGPQRDSGHRPAAVRRRCQPSVGGDARCRPQAGALCLADRGPRAQRVGWSAFTPRTRAKRGRKRRREASAFTAGMLAIVPHGTRHWTTTLATGPPQRYRGEQQPVQMHR